MPFDVKNVVRTWLFITIISIAAVNAYPESGERRIDLKIGFDLTQGANGAPSLRIRDFEESSELNPRAVEESAETKPEKIRADSFSGSDENDAKSAPIQRKPDSSKEKESKSKESAKSISKEDDTDEEDNDSASGENKKISTRGLKAADYEPEENPKIHGIYRQESGEQSDSTRRRRRKRYAVFRNKNKWRKYSS